MSAAKDAAPHNEEGGSHADGIVKRKSTPNADVVNQRQKYSGKMDPPPAKNAGGGCCCGGPTVPIEDVDVVLIGAGSMSITVGLMLAQLNQKNPNFKIKCFERLGAVAQESTNGWNNAGTGHSALCEPNYTPFKDSTEQEINISKAVTVNENFQLSRQYWAYLVKTGLITDPNSFINVTPHITFGVGDQLDWSQKRFDTLKKNPLFKGIEHTTDHAVMKKWCPVMFKGRNPDDKCSMTRVDYGTDVDFGALCQAQSKAFLTLGGDLELFTCVTGLKRDKDGKSWLVTVKAADLGSGKRTFRTKFVFVGAGGWALLLLQMSGIPEIKGFLGFPISGEFLVCQKKELAEQHRSKCYGKAAIGAPPMSVPHLDSRIIGGKKMILFGPFAGFSPRYLKTGSLLDLVKAVKYHNLIPAAAAGLQNLDLTVYLVKQLAATKAQKLGALQVFVPEAKAEDWSLQTAGQRVQIMKKDAQKWGVLQFGTEVVHSEDLSICGLLGASPGASTAVQVALDVIRECFPNRLDEWTPELKKMIESYDTKLASDPVKAERISKETAKYLQIAGMK